MRNQRTWFPSQPTTNIDTYDSIAISMRQLHTQKHLSHLITPLRKLDSLLRTTFSPICNESGRKEEVLIIEWEKNPKGKTKPQSIYDSRIEKQVFFSPFFPSTLPNTTRPGKENGGCAKEHGRYACVIYAPSSSHYMHTYLIFVKKNVHLWRPCSTLFNSNEMMDLLREESEETEIIR